MLTAMLEHPNRPQKPARPIPMAGDDNSAWRAWWNACDACRHRDAKLGCVEGGVITYANGAQHGVGFCVPGGCKAWTPRSA